MTPGPKCRDWDEVAMELKNTISFLKDSTSDFSLEKRANISDKFNYYKNDFCHRVADRFITTYK